MDDCVKNSVRCHRAFTVTRTVTVRELILSLGLCINVQGERGTE